MDSIDFLKTVGEKIKEARNEQKITVRELGLLCSLDYSHISRLENGGRGSDRALFRAARS